MKKYLLTALLGVFCLFSFASADTVGNFTSDSTICTVSLDGSSVSVGNLGCSGGDTMNYCFSTASSPFYANLFYNTLYIDSSVKCFNNSYYVDDVDLSFYSDVDLSNDKSVSGTLYISASAITYNNSSQGSGGGSSSGSGSGILIGGTSAFNGIINSVSSTILEFIPYVVYIGLGVLGSIIGFAAIRWLVNYIRYKVLGVFSSRRRK